jgi:tRNA (guanine-N7-)-methyltransferase
MLKRRRKIHPNMTKLIEQPEFLEKQAYFLIPLEKGKMLDFQELFQNSNPVFLEIGSGKGEFISEYALLHPEWNFMGFELQQKRVDLIIRKLDLSRYQNVKLATCLIDKNVSSMIAENSVTGVFIQHPDPWPKRRHFKRRLVQQSLLDALTKIIQPGGFIQVSTDHAEYAQWIWKEFSKRQDFFPKLFDGLSDVPLLDEHIVTFYEREQRRLGFEPKHMLFEKRHA